MDNRTARRAAEKAARTLLNTRAALVGELGVAHAEHTQLADDVTAVAARGRQLVADAETEAARLVADAQTRAADGQQRYTDAYTAAIAAGWTSTELTALGFQPGNSAAPPRRRRTPPAEHTPQHLTLPEQTGAPEPATSPLPTT